MEDTKEKHKPKDSKVSKQTHIIEETNAAGEKQYNCTACRKTFRSRSQKYYHLNCNQLQDMIYKCDHCDKCFARHSQWKYHMESHTSPVNECPNCQKTFSNPLALKKHEALHKVEPKPCPHCNKTFQKKISLQQHIAAQHLNQLQFGCAYCNKKYASKSTLHLHLQSHEKKRFECTICGKLFQRNSILNLHLKRHYQTNNYSCPACQKIFSESGALSRHRKIHEENALQYHCKLCNKNILRKDNMTRHLNTIHPKEKFEEIVDILRSSTEKTAKTHGADKTEVVDSGREAERIADKESTNGNTEKECNMNVNMPSSNEKCVILENKIIQSPINVQYSVFNELSKIPDELMLGNVNVISTDIQHNTNTNVTDQIIVKDIQIMTTLSTPDEKESKDILQYQTLEPDQQQQLEYTILNNFKEDMQEKTTYAQLSDIGNYNELQHKFDRHIEFIETSNDILKSYTESPLNQTKLRANEYDSFKIPEIPEIQDYFLFNDNKNPNKIDKFSNFSKTTQSPATSDHSQFLYPVPKEQNDYASNEFSTAGQFKIPGARVTQTFSSVIKSIGNVKKNLTPTIVKETKKPTSNANVTITKPTLYSLDLEYKHKKYSRNNYDIDLYRKILGCDEDDDNNYSENDDNHQEDVDQQQRSRESSNDTTNAASTPVHWRKSFKNNYETSAS